MKNAWETFKKYWKLFLGLFGVGVGVGIFILGERQNPQPPAKPLPDVKKENAEAEAKAKAEKERIEKQAAEDKAKVESMTTDEVVNSLDPATKAKIDDIKQKASSDATKSIMDRIMEEQNHG